MEVSEFAWLDRAFELFSWIVAVASSASIALWRRCIELQAKYPQLLSLQTVFGLTGTTLGIWKWWESREVNLFKRFESMIEGQEVQLIKARSDLLDVLNRPGPGLLIRPPIFTERALRQVLARRRWHTSLLALAPVASAMEQKLASAISTCDRKVSAHLDRLAYFRHQIASARLIHGTWAAGRAARAAEVHEQQRLDHEALDHFRAVLALPGHKEDVAALECIAHQLGRLDGQSQSAINAYQSLIDTLEGQQELPSRNLMLARVKRSLAILRYPTAPGIAQGLLADAINLLTQFGPPRDRDLLELAEAVHLDGIARLRLRMVILGPQQLDLAQGHYRDLTRSLRSRRRGLFSWMSRARKFTGHRVAELRARAERGLAQVDHLINLNEKRQVLLIARLAKGNGVPRHNRKPPRLPTGR